MKNQLNQRTQVWSPAFRRLGAVATQVWSPAFRRFGLASALLCALAATFALAKNPLANTSHYQQVNLVSDQAGQALLQDPDLVNAWGISFAPTGPFWISDNGTGKSTLYAVTNDASGTTHAVKQGLIIHIPGEGNVTGQLFNNSGAFHTNLFIFASEDGIISGWRGALGTNAEILVSRPNAIYKGIALATNNNGPVLLAANFAEGSIDMYGTNLTTPSQFRDFSTPADYAPFNVQNLGGIVFVTFAKKEAGGEDDVPGAGNGVIDVFDPRSGIFTRFATGSDAGGNLHQLNSPWGLAVAPANFGKYSDALLVGNFGSGTILAFDSNGNLEGYLKADHGGPLVIDGLWGLTFGNGVRAGSTSKLYFTAGPDGESHGLFGSLEPASGSDD